MNRKKFLKALQRKLISLPSQERKDVLDYYSEIIGDGVESGKPEEEVIASLGSVDEISKRILSERRADGVKSSGSAVKTAAVTTGLVLGSPIWLPLLIVLFVCCWVVVICIVSVFASLFAAALALGLAFIGGIVSFFFLLSGNPLGAVFQIGAGILSLGLGVLLLIGLLKLGKYILKALKYFLSAPIRLYHKMKGGSR